jgi:cysteine desulfuration protein SufE
MSSITVQYEDYADALEMIDDEDLRFEYIIDMGKKVKDEDFPETLRTDENLMHGCMSQVWLHDQVSDGKHYFTGFSDAIIVKGLVAMMAGSFSGLTAEQLQQLNTDHVRRLNLGALTTQRQVGMMTMLDTFKKFGLAGGGTIAQLRSNRA